MQRSLRYTWLMSRFAIGIDQLTKRFSDVAAVYSLNLRVNPGEIYGAVPALFSRAAGLPRQELIGIHS